MRHAMASCVYQLVVLPLFVAPVPPKKTLTVTGAYGAPTGVLPSFGAPRPNTNRRNRSGQRTARWLICAR